MRRLSLLLLVSLAVAVPASAADVDPKRLVISGTDVPDGFRVDDAGTGLRTNAYEIRREPRLAALFRRWKRLTGYEAEYDRGDAKIEARVDVLGARAGARQMLDWYDREVRKAGLKGLRRTEGRVGDQAWIYSSPHPTFATVIAWRHGRLFAGMLGQGISRERTLALARSQQRRMVAALPS